MCVRGRVHACDVYGLRRKGGCMRMMMMVLVLSTLVLFSTLDINFMYACMRLMLLANIKPVAI